MENSYSNDPPDFMITTCLDWKHLLEADRFKDIITDSLTYLVKVKRIKVYGFVSMNTPFHLIWQMLGGHKREEVRRDFLKYTGQQILKHIRNEQSELLHELLVQAKNRKHQV